MATYTELYAMSSADTLRDRIAVAITIKAHAIAGATPTATQIEWVNAALATPQSKVSAMLAYVLAANKTAAVVTILAASDSTLQTNIDAAVDALVL